MASINAVGIATHKPPKTIEPPRLQQPSGLSDTNGSTGRDVTPHVTVDWVGGSGGRTPTPVNITESNKPAKTVQKANTTSDAVNTAQQLARVGTGAIQGAMKIREAPSIALEALGVSPEISNTILTASTGIFPFANASIVDNIVEAAPEALEVASDVWGPETVSTGNVSLDNLGKVNSFVDSWVPAPRSNVAKGVATISDVIGEAIPATAAGVATGGGLFVGNTASYALGAANAFSSEMVEGSGDFNKSLNAAKAAYTSESIGGKLFSNVGVLGNIIGEGLEENIDSYIQHAYEGTKYEVGEKITDFALGSIAGAALQGGANVASSVSSLFGGNNTNSNNTESGNPDSSPSNASSQLLLDSPEGTTQTLFEATESQPLLAAREELLMLPESSEASDAIISYDLDAIQGALNDFRASEGTYNDTDIPDGLGGGVGEAGTATQTATQVSLLDELLSDVEAEVETEADVDVDTDVAVQDDIELESEVDVQEAEQVDNAVSDVQEAVEAEATEDVEVNENTSTNPNVNVISNIVANAQVEEAQSVDEEFNPEIIPDIVESEPNTRTSEEETEEQVNVNVNDLVPDAITFEDAAIYDNPAAEAQIAEESREAFARSIWSPLSSEVQANSVIDGRVQTSPQAQAQENVNTQAQNNNRNDTEPTERDFNIFRGRGNTGEIYETTSYNRTFSGLSSY